MRRFRYFRTKQAALQHKRVLWVMSQKFVGSLTGSLTTFSRLKAALRATVLAYVPSQRKLADSIMFVKHTVKASGVAAVEANSIFHARTCCVLSASSHTNTHSRSLWPKVDF